MSREEANAFADQAIQIAISTDPEYAFAYYVRGISWFFTKHKFKQGVEDFQRALELDPYDAFLVAAIGKGALLTGNRITSYNVCYTKLLRKRRRRTASARNTVRAAG